ncbi:hypothetical protein ACWGTI_15395 [Mesorhizobium sp. ArgA1]
MGSIGKRNAVGHAICDADVAVGISLRVVVADTLARAKKAA